MKKTLLFSLVILLLLALSIQGVFAQKTSFSLTQGMFASGTTQTENYQATTGQVVVGSVGEPIFNLTSGFWTQWAANFDSFLELYLPMILR